MPLRSTSRTYYAGRMNAVGLPARIGYAVAALGAVGVAAFYASIWLLPHFVAQGADDDDGYGLFRAALGIALGLGVTAALVGLTLPWKRRKRRGRGRRIAVAAVVVVLISIGFASQEHKVIYDLLFAAWMAYALAFTYVRHGVLDPPNTRSVGESAASAATE
jgi:Kef-type K+ transport system membrane component KefB